MYKILFLCFLFLTVTETGVQAQALTNSPYSRFGIGDLFQANAVRNQSMGGIGIGSSHSGNINRLNPASYRRLNFTTLEFSGFGEIMDLRSSTDQNRLNASGVNQFAMAFPTQFKATFAFGLTPYSVSGYRFQNTYPLNLDTIQAEYMAVYGATGGLNNFFIGGAVSILKGLDVGMNAEFIFGNTSSTWNLSFEQSTGFLPANYNRRMYHQGFNLNLGAQYTDTLALGNDRKVVAKIGFAWDRGARLNSDQYTTSITSSFTGLSLDTVSSFRKDITQIPSRLGLGFEFEKYIAPGTQLDKIGYWSAGLDFTYQNWTGFRFFDTDPGFRSSMRVAAGGEWIPRIQSKIYLLKMAYRIGGFTEQSHLVVNNTPFTNIGVSWGFGLPFPRMASKIQIGFEIGKRGTTDAQLISETWYRLRLGFTLNERWFLRYRQD